MSTLKVLHEVVLFDDSEDSNDPDQVRIKYKLSQEEELTGDVRIDRTFPNSATTASGLPTGTYDWLYVLTDQPIALRFDGSSDDVMVEPSENGTKDGLLIKRGEFETLSINVPGTDDAGVFIMVGEV